MTIRTIGETICTLRKEKGMTQKELAEALHVTDKAVSKWERGGSLPDTATIPYLAEILGVSIETLMQAKSVPAPINKEGCPLRAALHADSIADFSPLYKGIRKAQQSSSAKKKSSAARHGMRQFEARFVSKARGHRFVLPGTIPADRSYLFTMKIQQHPKARSTCQVPPAPLSTTLAAIQSSSMDACLFPQT